MGRRRLKQGRAADFICYASRTILVALLRHLSPKWILRMRAVCTAWCNALSYPQSVLHALHNAAPPQMLLCFERSACPDRGGIRLTTYCVESLVLRTGALRPVFRFDYNEYRGPVEDAEGRDAPPILDSPAVNYEKMGDGHVDASPKPQLVLHASLNGYLLVSLDLSLYVVCPATRNWVALPETPFDLVAFYEHRRSAEYRVLCASCLSTSTCCFVLSASSLPPPEVHFVGYVPTSPAPPDDTGSQFGLALDKACVSPPIQFPFRGNLHWSPQKRLGYLILVFDVNAEQFSWMSPPVRDQDMRLLELLPLRKLGLSVSMKNRATLELWCLEDYHNEIWALMYRIQLAVDQVPLAPFLNSEEDWTPAVVSPEGDVLIECANWLLLCDRNGNLRRKFWFPEGPPFAVRHVVRETLFLHTMFRKYHCDGDPDAPPFFNWLCGDPTW